MAFGGGVALHEEGAGQVEDQERLNACAGAMTGATCSQEHVDEKVAMLLADHTAEVREHLQQRDITRCAVDAAVVRDFYNVLDRVSRILCCPQGERAAIGRLRADTRAAVKSCLHWEPESEPEPGMELDPDLFAQYLVLAQQKDLDETAHALELHRAKLLVMSMRKEVSEWYCRIDDALDHRQHSHDEISADITGVVEEALRALDQRLFIEHSAKQSALRSRMIVRLDTQRNSAQEEIKLRESALSSEARQMLRDNNSEWERQLQDTMNAHEAAKKEWEQLLQQNRDDLVLARHELRTMQNQLARVCEVGEKSAEKARNILRKRSMDHAAQLEAEKQQCNELQQALDELRREHSLMEFNYSKALAELENQKSLAQDLETQLVRTNAEVLAVQEERQREMDLYVATQAQSQVRAQDETIAKLQSDLGDAVAKIKELYNELGTTKQAMVAATKKKLVGSFKAAALHAAKEKEAKEKLAYLQKQVGHLTRENRQLGSKVNQLGFLLSQAYVASQGKPISKVNLDGNGEDRGETASEKRKATPPNCSLDEPASRQRWGNIRTTRMRAAAVNTLILGPETQHADPTNPATADVLGMQDHQQKRTPMPPRQERQHPTSTAHATAALLRPMSGTLMP